jgi:hypothetical protein
MFRAPTFPAPPLAGGPPEAADPPSDGGWSIAEAGRDLGLAPDTLRKWQHALRARPQPQLQRRPSPLRPRRPVAPAAGPRPHRPRRRHRGSRPPGPAGRGNRVGVVRLRPGRSPTGRRGRAAGRPQRAHTWSTRSSPDAGSSTPGNTSCGPSSSPQAPLPSGPPTPFAVEHVLSHVVHGRLEQPDPTRRPPGRPGPPCWPAPRTKSTSCRWSRSPPHWPSAGSAVPCSVLAPRLPRLPSFLGRPARGVRAAAPGRPPNSCRTRLPVPRSWPPDPAGTPQRYSPPRIRHGQLVARGDRALRRINRRHG